jgi:hypothetical protein
MNRSTLTSPTAVRRIAPLFSACAIALFLSTVGASQASAALELRPLADPAAKLPVSSDFKKVTGEGGPYVLTLKNTSKSALTVKGKVLLSISFHAESKARQIPEHIIEADTVWTISELAAGDKVVLTAKDYAPLELTVP